MNYIYARYGHEYILFYIVLQMGQFTAVSENNDSVLQVCSSVSCRFFQALTCRPAKGPTYHCTEWVRGRTKRPEREAEGVVTSTMY